MNIFICSPSRFIPSLNSAPVARSTRFSTSAKLHFSACRLRQAISSRKHLESQPQLFFRSLFKEPAPYLAALLAACALTKFYLIGKSLHLLATRASCEQLVPLHPIYNLNLCSVSMSSERHLKQEAVAIQVKVTLHAEQKDEGDEISPWLDDVKEEALKRGLSQDTVLEALREVYPSEKIIQLDQNQPESKLTADAYLKMMVTEFRIAKGVKAFMENSELLKDVSSCYGVPASVLTSIWGVESSYGSFPGSWNVIQALVTLAYASSKPTRAAYFREELFHALFILDKGYGPADPSGLKGSWAGAMGQCQFMPSSYRNYAVDYDQDGRKDIWDSKPDIFASMANYLVKHGWKTGGPFAQKVHVPADLDLSLCGFDVKKQVHEWLKHGLVPDGALQLDENETVSLVAPDGPSGVAYLACDNFRVVMRYNTSPLYCMSIFELAREIDSRVGTASTVAEV